MTEKMHYFRPVEGHACRRFGSESFIGCTRGPKGYTWNTDVVVAISDTEMMPYRKDYTSYLRHGDLKRATKSEYEEWLAKRKAATEKAKADREQRIADEAKAAEAKAAKANEIDDGEHESVDKPPLTKAQRKAAKKAAAAASSTTDSEASASEATTGDNA